MKKFYLFLIVSLMGLLSVQAYTPLVREGVRWIYVDEYDTWDSDLVAKVKRYYIMQFKGDTIIDGVKYSKCFRKSNFNLNDYPNAVYCSDTEPVAFVREADGVVYAINETDPEAFIEPYLAMLRPDYENSGSRERVIYDFNMTDDAVVTTVDVKGVPCKSIKYNGYGTVIEGIGNVENGDMLNLICLSLTGAGITSTHLSHVMDSKANVLYKRPDSDKSYYDLNSDGQVDVTDVNLMIDKILGKN